MMSASSTIEGKKLDFSFTITYTGFSSLPHNEYTESPIMIIEDTSWTIRLYPRGKACTSNECTSVFLVSYSVYTVEASYKIILDKNPAPTDKAYHLLSCSNGDQHRQSFEEQEEYQEILLSNSPSLSNSCNNSVFNEEFLVDDQLIITVDLLIYRAMKRKLITYTSGLNIIKDSSTLSKDLSVCLFDETTSDMLIIAGTGTSGSYNDINVLVSSLSNPKLQFGEKSNSILVHKFMLSSRSPVFKAMLAIMPMEIRVPDFEPVVVREFIKYLYTDTCDPDMLKLHGEMLLAIACKYQVSGLEALCENHLMTTLTVDNVVNILKLANLYNAQQLKLRTIQYIKTVKRDLITMEFIRELPNDIANELLQIIGITVKYTYI